MKYEVLDVVTVYPPSEIRYVTVATGEAAKTFPADQSNTDYAQFLVDAQLTDTEVHALTPDVWYDFPKETN